MTIGNNFRAQFNTYRKLVGLSQDIFANAVGMSPNRFSEKLTGRSGTSFDLPETKQIIKTLVQYKALAEAGQASLLLHTLYPTYNFTDDEWQSEPLVSLLKQQQQQQNQNIPQDYLLLSPVMPVTNSVLLTTTTTTTTTRATAATNIAPGTVLTDIQTINETATPLLDVPSAIIEHVNQVFRKLPPKPLTRLVGRTKEIDTCLNFLTNTDRARLLTLTGLGGVGKTRLVTEVAYKLDEAARAIYEGDIVFISLVHVKTSTQLALELCATFDLPLYAGAEVEDKLIEEATRLLVNNLRSKSKPLLLILDNFEQIVNTDATSVDFITAILQGAPNLQIIVTSRESLRREFEQLLELEGLPLPPKDEKDLAVIANYGAIELFLRQVQNRQPDFIFDNENARLVADICYKLDGLPLALELVAAQINPRTVQQIWSMLTSSSAASTRVYHNKPLRYAPRHQSLFDALDSSYKWLSSEEKSLFRRLSVFIGGATLETILQICYAPVTAGKGRGKLSWELKINELLNSLYHKSLIKIVPGSQESRYFLLEMPKQFAWFCLQEEDGEQEVKNIQERYADYYLALAEQAAPAINQHADAHWTDLLLEDKANLLTALDYLVKTGQVVKAYQMGAALGPFWFRSRLFAEGVEQTNAVLSMITANNELPDELLQARFLHQAGRLNNSNDGDRVKATSLFSKAEKIWRELNDNQGLCLTLSGLGAVFYWQNNYEKANKVYKESADLARQIGDEYSLATALSNLGNMAMILEQYQQAKAFYTEGLPLEQKLDNKPGIAKKLKNLATIAKVEKKYQTAYNLYNESLDIYQKYNYQRDIAEIFLLTTKVDYFVKDYPAFKKHSYAGIQMTQKYSVSEFLPYCLLNFAVYFGMIGNEIEKTLKVLKFLGELCPPGLHSFDSEDRVIYDAILETLQLDKEQKSSFENPFAQQRDNQPAQAQETQELHNLIWGFIAEQVNVFFEPVSNP